MKTYEQKINLNEATPTHCKYCDEDKSFLMIKPLAMCLDGQTNVNINLTNTNNWICLECLAMEIDMLGHSVDIQEY